MIVRTECIFDAAHQIPNHPGKCARLHGHTWRVVIEVDGTVDTKTGMIVDFGDLKSIVRKFDHELVNQVVSFLPTAENLVEHFLGEIESLFAQKEVMCNCVTVEVWESADSYARDTITYSK